MVEVSDKWKEKFNETLVPESFVEITCGITAVSYTHLTQPTIA